MAAWKIAYLIRGDDHGQIGERRGRLRAQAEAESGAAAVETVAAGIDPSAVAVRLGTMTLGLGRRYVIVDGVEQWKAADIHDHIGPALTALAGTATTVALIACEQGRSKAPEALVAVVKKIGGDVLVHAKLKAKALPAWAIAQAKQLGVALEPAAAQSLVTNVGERQQRILRELEKLALEYGPGANIGVEEVEQAGAHSAERQVWGLVDALIARDRRRAFSAYLELRDQGQDVAGLTAIMARRVREVLEIARRLADGQAPAQIKEQMRGNPWVLERRIAEAQGSDLERLGHALETLAELELKIRGRGDADSETAAIRAIGRIATPR